MPPQPVDAVLGWNHIPSPSYMLPSVAHSGTQNGSSGKLAVLSVSALSL